MFLVLGIMGIYVECSFTLASISKYGARIVKSTFFHSLVGRSWIGARIRNPLLFVLELDAVLLIIYLAIEKLTGVGVHYMVLHVFTGDLLRLIRDFVDALFLVGGLSLNIVAGVEDLGRSLGLGSRRTMAATVGVLGYMGMGMGVFYTVFYENLEVVVTIIQVSAFSLFMYIYYRIERRYFQ